MSDTATLYLIRRAVCAHYKITNADLVGRSCVRSIAWPRQVAMMLAREMTALSLPQIARRFGNRDHTTVLHGIRAVQARAAANPHYAEQVEAIKSIIAEARANIDAADLWDTLAAADAVAQFLTGIVWPPPPKPIRYRWGRAYRPLCLDRADTIGEAL